MDILDNIIFANLNRPVTGGAIQSDYLQGVFNTYMGAPGFILNQDPNTLEWNYLNDNKMFYSTFDDIDMAQRSAIQHWHNINNGDVYSTLPDIFSDFSGSTSPYHLIYSYLLENTRLLHILEKVIEKYLHDEDLGIADGNFQQAFQWMTNTERLFFKNDQSFSYTTRSLIRPNAESSRRNAYYRMFGIDLAFGDNAQSTVSNSYHKAKASNQQFIVLFERYLSEIWQAYINVQNTSGPNTTDIENLLDIAEEIQELLLAKRGNNPNYAYQNLSYEEFTSVLMLTWFGFVLTFDSPIVTFLGCGSNTFGSRLQKIGSKVGVPAHKRSQELFEMAAPSQTVLRSIETGGVLDNNGFVALMLSSLLAAPPAGVTNVHVAYMQNLLIIINNWEKATGHKIKNPESNIRGTVSIAQPQRTNGKLVTSN